jgi:hypothetical protein
MGAFDSLLDTSDLSPGDIGYLLIDTDGAPLSIQKAVPDLGVLAARVYYNPLLTPPDTKLVTLAGAEVTSPIQPTPDFRFVMHV